MGEILNDRLMRFVERTSAENEELTLTDMEHEVGSGVGLAKVCRAWDIPYQLFMQWLRRDLRRYARYELALKDGARYELDEAKEIADTSPVQVVDAEGKPLCAENGEPLLAWPDVPRDKLRLDARFRRAKINDPDKFGDRVQVTTVERMEVVLERPALELLGMVRGRVIDGTGSEVPRETLALEDFGDDDGGV